MKKWKFKCNYCGIEEEANYFWLLLKALFKPRFYKHCKNCHKTSCYLFMPRMVHDSTDDIEKEYNRQNLWDDRI